ncbi:MAG: glycerol kinase GlpK [Deltaproteobacteria bacterium]|nr:glycerol kinase GlpK [Deltaproteobacteria bacterium]
MKYILAIDQGTTSSRALIVNHKGEIIAVGQHPFEQIYPQSGWVEHRLDDIWASTLSAIQDAIEKGGIDPLAIAAIAITNQRETACAWDRKSGDPLHHAIVWQDRRTSNRCQELKREGIEPKIQKKTGLLADPYFSATKFEWLLKSAQLSEKNLALGTVDSFLIARLSGLKSHVTDASNASRTLLMDLRKLKWDSELLKLFGIREDFLPEIVASSGECAITRGLDFLPDGIPITGIVGDQQAALFGQCCFNVSESKCTLGTGAFVLINTGNEPVFSQNKLLTTVAWQIGNHTCYALEGSAFIAGAAIEWLREGLGLIKEASELDTLAQTVSDTEEVVFVPALTGLGAPYWKTEARGMLKGLTRGTTRGQIARAVIEGIALEITELIEAMEKDMDHAVPMLKVDGGASRSRLLLQELADLLECPVVRPQIVESTALGAAYLAGLGIGYWKNTEELETFWQPETSFEPRPVPEHIAHLKMKWTLAIESL